jgi:hypothetical protein
VFEKNGPSWDRRPRHHFPLASQVDSCHNWNTACHLGASQHYLKANTSVFQQTVFCSRVSPLTEAVGGKLRLLERQETRLELHVLFFAAQLPSNTAIKPVSALGRETATRAGRMFLFADLCFARHCLT